MRTCMSVRVIYAPGNSFTFHPGSMRTRHNQKEAIAMLIGLHSTLVQCGPARCRSALAQDARLHSTLVQCGPIEELKKLGGEKSLHSTLVQCGHVIMNSIDDFKKLFTFHPGSMRTRVRPARWVEEEGFTFHPGSMRTPSATLSP